MAGADHTSGYFFAQQFDFKNVRELGYCGIQNRRDKDDGKSVVHAVFSSFQDGTTTDDSNCHSGADDGPGYDVTYNITVENTSGTRWKGTAVNTATGEGVHIGSYTLPPGAGGIRMSQVGFVEYYPWNAGSHECRQLPKTSVTMLAPTSKTPGAGQGRMDKPYEYGDCVDQVDFADSAVENGWRIEVGFPEA
ncbi:hypothetical protein NLU13_9051 [Sarocladium strictum]|uniref:Uncharacterized protein n=1 Tax=Sarocladium strictum TaxID=5046 RepID=A0AA39G9E8_SARSR|nr:hypothetical protein NLU13_9051 [Sarocladium strictum]